MLHEWSLPRRRYQPDAAIAGYGTTRNLHRRQPSKQFAFTTHLRRLHAYDLAWIERLGKDRPDGHGVVQGGGTNDGPGHY